MTPLTQIRLLSFKDNFKELVNLSLKNKLPNKLIFSGKKPVLSRWIIQDESGSTTLMSIERYEENIALGEMQFNIQLEIERRRN